MIEENVMEEDVRITYTKRVLRLPELVRRSNYDRQVFPQGMVCRVLPYAQSEFISRVELLSERFTNAGILKKLHVSYTASRKLLEMAQLSGGVVEARSVDWKRKHEAEAYKHVALLLKGIGEETKLPADTVLVSDAWLDGTGLDAGDRIIVSNTMHDYMIPPPEEAIRTK